MVSFQRKKISRAPRVGELLRAARQKAGLSVEKTARELGIASKYLQALENGRDSFLPGEIYTKNFIKKYAELVGLEANNLLSQYIKEKPLANAPNLFHPSLSSFWRKPYFLRHSLALTVVVVLIIYLGIGLKGIFSPPPLQLENPLEGVTVEKADLTVKGQTSPETRVQINGREVTSNLRGFFEDQVILQPGLNTIVVTAAKKHGRPKMVTREVIYDEKINY